jgi:hypothetical protein
MGHLLLTKACLLIKHGPLHNPLRGRQTFTRQTDFATKPEMFFSIRDYFVSILYEADRLCNGRQRVNVALMFPFQSSTRQTDFATPAGPESPPSRGRFNPLRGRQTLQPGANTRSAQLIPRFNPLRGRQTLQRAPSQGRTSARSCFNPLRGRQTLQRGEAKQNRFHCPVSILYEAGRLCNCPCQEAAPDRGS